MIDDDIYIYDQATVRYCLRGQSHSSRQMGPGLPEYVTVIQKTGVTYAIVTFAPV